MAYFIRLIFSRFIYVVACIRTSFLFMVDESSIVWIYHSLFIHLSVDEHLGCFYLLAIVTHQIILKEIGGISFSFINISVWKKKIQCVISKRSTRANFFIACRSTFSLTYSNLHVFIYTTPLKAFAKVTKDYHFIKSSGQFPFPLIFLQHLKLISSSFKHFFS